MKFIFVVVHIFLVALTGCMPAQNSMDKQYETLEKLDLSRVPDGTFLGKYDNNDMEYQVAVTVEKHMIICINLINGMQKKFRKKCALCNTRELIRNIVDWQTVNQVDGVSGATQTSDAILNAIKDALLPPFHPIGDGQCAVPRHDTPVLKCAGLQLCGHPFFFA